jgi:hypothetical protein
MNENEIGLDYTPDWKEEYQKAVDLHCLTLDELREGNDVSEIKTEIKQNPDGSFTINDGHSTADVVRWLLTQDSKETVLYLLGAAPQRKWIGLSEKEMYKLWLTVDEEADRMAFGKAVEDKLKEKNT